MWRGSFCRDWGLDRFLGTTGGSDEPSVQEEVNTMAIGVNSSKTGARPSHEAIESDADATMVGKSDQKKMDHAAMESAKRAENRIHSNEETTPGNSIFSK